MYAGLFPLLLALSRELSPEDIERAFNEFSASYLYEDANARIPDTTSYLDQYDFIIVGAGPGGCVMANRLSENPNWNVLLLEAGREENLLLSVPMTATLNVGFGYNWNYRPEKMVTACMGQPNGTCPWPRGKGLGGSTLLNLMIYTRGHEFDYELWESMGNYGWSYKDVLPYFEKAEQSYEKTSKTLYETLLVSKFYEAMRRKGYLRINSTDKDPLGFYKIRSQTTDGQRYSASRNYLHPIRNRSNLHISVDSRVTKLLIDSNTKVAYGVEFSKHGQSFKAVSTKEVILCAGSINSPQLLMLSGVGPRHHLESIGIPVINSLPVGYNLHDHCAYDLYFRVNQTVTFPEDKTTEELFTEYLTNHTGPFTVTSRFESIAFVQTGHINPTHFYPNVELLLASAFIDGSDNSKVMKLLGLTDAFQKSIFVNYKGRDRFSIVPILMHPKSRGRISLKSANPFEDPLMQPNYLSNEYDIKTLVEGIQFAIELAESESFAQYGAKLDPTPVTGCEHLPFRSEKYWRCAIRFLGRNSHHQAGTCAMGPAGSDSVVDPELRVHGIKNLRVVDASIFPLPISGHPTGVLYMVGEKAAEMVKKNWL